MLLLFQCVTHDTEESGRGVERNKVDTATGLKLSLKPRIAKAQQKSEFPGRLFAFHCCFPPLSDRYALKIEGLSFGHWAVARFASPDNPGLNLHKAGIDLLHGCKKTGWAAVL